MKNPVLFFCLLAAFLPGACVKDRITGTNNPIVSVGEVRALYKGSKVVLQSADLYDAAFISGTVISNPAQGNVPAGLVILQNNRHAKLRGIALALGDAAKNYTAGDSLVVHIEGAVLDRVNGVLQIAGIPDTAIQKVSSGNPQPIAISTSSLADITSHIDDYECTLVQLKSAIIQSGTPNQRFSGDLLLSDWWNIIGLHTEPSAAFADSITPSVGDYTGIALRMKDGDSSKPVLWVRSHQDVVGLQLEPHLSRQQYANFPEGWESINPSDPGNASSMLTGQWLFNGVSRNSSSTITLCKHGTWTILMGSGKDETLETSFNLPYGASRFSFYYGAAVPGKDGACTVRAEYSQDAGTTWKPLGPDLQVKDATVFYYADYPDLDIRGPVRFRVHKPTTGDGVIDQGRLSVDDITVYQN